jgi:NAD(P)-dependent dehydrogenase (short-subunit alcohol dehydrogenase family)
MDYGLLWVPGWTSLTFLRGRIMTLSNQVAIVTGGGNGIGRAIALRLAHDGADVVIAGRRQATLEECGAAVRAQGRKALPVVTDVSREDDVSAMVKRALEAFGRIDILVNNAGIIGPTAPVVSVKRADWDEVMAINLTGAYLCAKAVLPDMIARRSGKIINISSIAGKVAYALRSPYAVSKWGMIGLTLTLAQEAGPSNIQVNVVCPGPVAGERMRRVIEHRAAELGRPAAEVERIYVEDTALKRMATEEDVAALVAFLASSEADNITGQAIDVSAGHSL